MIRIYVHSFGKKKKSQISFDSLRPISRLCIQFYLVGLRVPYKFTGTKQAYLTSKPYRIGVYFKMSKQHGSPKMKN